MTDNVSIPADVAKNLAQWHRDMADEPGPVPFTVLSPSQRAWHKAQADQLDPKPPTLHEQVAERLRVTGDLCTGLSEVTADAVLTVVAEAPIEQLIALVGPRFADWLAAQPFDYKPEGERCRHQRDHDVRLLRGGS